MRYHILLILILVISSIDIYYAYADVTVSQTENLSNIVSYNVFPAISKQVSEDMQSQYYKDYFPPISRQVSESLNQVLNKYYIPPVFKQVIENLSQNFQKYYIPSIFRQVIENIGQDFQKFYIPPIFEKVVEGISESFSKSTIPPIVKNIVEELEGSLPSLINEGNETGGFEVNIPSVTPNINVGFLSSDVNRFLLGIAVVGISFVAHPVFALISLIGLALAGYFGAYGFLIVFLAVAGVIFMIYIKVAGGGGSEEL